MINPQPVTLMNTGLPLAALGTLAFLLPRLMLARETRSHRRLAMVLLAGFALVLLTSFAIFAYTQVQAGTDLAGSFRASPMGTIAILMRPALLSGIIWLPLLALSGFNLAHRIENLRGNDMMKAPPERKPTP